MADEGLALMQRSNGTKTIAPDKSGRFIWSPPAAVQPQPLLGIFAHPAFDHRGHRLHGAGDIDIAGGVARGFHLVADLAPKAVAVGIAHHAKPVDRRAGLP